MEQTEHSAPDAFVLYACVVGAVYVAMLGILCGTGVIGAAAEKRRAKRV